MINKSDWPPTYGREDLKITIRKSAAIGQTCTLDKNIMPFAGACVKTSNRQRSLNLITKLIGTRK